MCYRRLKCGFIITCMEKSLNNYAIICKSYYYYLLNYLMKNNQISLHSTETIRVTNINIIILVSKSIFLHNIC